MGPLELSPPTLGCSLVDWLASAVERAAPNVRCHVDARRSAAGISDLTVILDGENCLRGSVHQAWLRALNALPAVESCKVGPNKVGIRLRGDALCQQLRAAPAQLGTLFGLSRALAGRRYIIDCCDPNATKALHLGHLRNLAIGACLGSVLRSLGGQVVLQMVLGDIGRNVCEALAGYLRHGEALEAASAGRKGDALVGECYARYVQQTALPLASSHEGDVIQRELIVKDDLADQLLHRWKNKDPETLRSWSVLVNKVAAGQTETLRALGIRFDRVLLESDGMRASESLVSQGLATQALVSLADGAIAFATGREDYPALLLVRPDGIPTEHLRALPLWWDLQEEVATSDRCFHVMGDEWVAPTGIRQDLLQRLGGTGFKGRYQVVAHGLVTAKGSRLSSSSGDAVLIDDLLPALGQSAMLERLAASSAGRFDAPALAKIVALGAFLARPTREPIEYCFDDLLSVELNPGMAVASALAGTYHLSANEPWPEHLDDDIRAALLQGHRLPGFFMRARLSGEPEQLIRFLHRQARLVLASSANPRAHRVSWAVLFAGAAGAGLASDEQSKA